jgi:phosphate starvation-inducible protein PhoH and related proteins
VTTETLTYETPQFLHSLFAGDLGVLKQLERDLELKITTREGWIRFEGDLAKVTQATALFGQLEAARRQGLELDRGYIGGEAGPDLKALASVRLLGNSRRPGVSPRTATQLAYIKAIESHDVTFGIGPAGTGKTYLAMAAAIAALKAKTVGRIVLTRPAVEAGEALGFLPGDMNEKVLPYLRPLYDALYDMAEPDEVPKMIERGQIEIAPLAYMRGRTLARSFVILDEAQNTTQAQMFMFLTRIGDGSKCVITGDTTQIDLPKPHLSGLVEAKKLLPGTEGISFIEFVGRDVVRHPVVQRIISAYERGRGTVGI